MFVPVSESLQYVEGVPTCRMLFITSILSLNPIVRDLGCEIFFVEILYLQKNFISKFKTSSV